MDLKNQFAWDPNKHDKKNKKPETTIFYLYCKCGGTVFAACHSGIQMIVTDGHGKIDFGPPLMMCLKCNAIVPPSQLEKSLERKVDHRQPPVETTKTPQ